jgi:hypothetical protein
MPNNLEKYITNKQLLAVFEHGIITCIEGELRDTKETKLSTSLAQDPTPNTK